MQGFYCQARGQRSIRTLGQIPMAKINKILAPADLSTHCKVGVQYALELAQTQDSEVVIFHVLTVEETPFAQADEEWLTHQTDLPKLKKTVEQRKALLNDFINQSFAPLLPNVNVRQEVAIGTPYKRIIEKAENEGFDMIIMSTHGRTGVLHMLIGSVTERVVRRAPCPVLAVPLHGKPEATTKQTNAVTRKRRSLRLRRRNIP